MKPVKPSVLVDGRTLLLPQSGGVFEYADRLIPALKAEGINLRTWANAWDAEPAPTVDIMTGWPNKLLNAGMRAFGAPRVDWMAGIESDLFWAPNAHFIAPPADAPFALTIHDLSFERYPEFFSPKRRLWHKAVGVRGLVERADALLAVSNQTAADLVELYGADEDKIVVTPLGVEPHSGPAWRPVGLPNRYILHVGTLEPRKNHLALIDAFNMLKRRAAYSDLGLVMAGPEGWNNAAVHRAIEESPNRDSITHLGFVTPEEKAALYRDAAVFAFPSFHEGFGLPPLEAMLYGTPVVASFIAPHAETLGDAAVLIDPYRPAELAEALHAVLDSAGFAERLAERGRKRAEAYTWNACAKKTADVFRTLAV